jgi:hypothetical protein
LGVVHVYELLFASQRASSLPNRSSIYLQNTAKRRRTKERAAFDLHHYLMEDAKRDAIKKRESAAAVVIQKWVRGNAARSKAHSLRQALEKNDESEFEEAEDAPGGLVMDLTNEGGVATGYPRHTRPAMVKGGWCCFGRNVEIKG